MARTILNTGASSGIGAATARAAVSEGWNVALVACTTAKLEALADKLGEAAIVEPGDVADFAGMKAAVAKNGRTLRRAARGLRQRWSGHRQARDRAWRPAGMAPGGGRQRDGRSLHREGRAAGAAQDQGPPAADRLGRGRRHVKGSIYGATKWFVHGYGGNMSEEMREWGGCCTVISPRMVDTPFFDEAKPDKLKPEDVAAAVLFALNQDPRAEVREINIMPTS
jgi:NADP-dependent 3-hydroxy acid dehydrogenase YdfG